VTVALLIAVAPIRSYICCCTFRRKSDKRIGATYYYFQLSFNYLTKEDLLWLGNGKITNNSNTTS
jgi:hypothetical protein